MDLFQKVDFISHAGIPMSWKIECDAISNDEWAALAKMIMEYQTEPFRAAIGIPRGGVKFADALNKYASGVPTDEVMVVDDVYTTGTSFREFIAENYPMWTMQQGFRWCVFARKPSDTVQGGFVKALFTMPTTSDQYD